MDRSAGRDDGNPTRLIATMVGIVGILLLGSLAWSAVGALFGAVGSVTSGLNQARPTALPIAAVAGSPTPGATPASALVLTATPGAAGVARTPTPSAAGTASATAQPTATREAGATATAGATAVPTARPTLAATAAPTPAATVAPTAGATPAATPASGRAPWILLPQPAPDARVAPGPITIEARGRGDAPITAIRLELDGVPLTVSLDQRSDSIWRGAATANVAPGAHAVRATVIDEAGRSGAYRWSFTAGT